MQSLAKETAEAPTSTPEHMLRLYVALYDLIGQRAKDGDRQARLDILEADRRASP